MWRSSRVRILVVWTAASLVAATVRATPPAPTADVEVQKGVSQVEEGDYDTALLTLDAAARRLVSDPSRSRELARAYLYLGIAYLAKGHETSARARFREALAQAGDLELEPDQFAPRVIELFEKAREDVKTTVPPPEKKGRKGLWIGAGVVAAGGGVALAVGSGGGTPSSPPPPRTLTFDGLLGARGDSSQHDFAAGASGSCQARLTWTDGGTEVKMFVLDAATGNAVTETVTQSTTSSMAGWTCGQGARYRIELFLQPPKIDVSFHLVVSVPG